MLTKFKKKISFKVTPYSHNYSQIHDVEDGTIMKYEIIKLKSFSKLWNVIINANGAFVSKETYDDGSEFATFKEIFRDGAVWDLMIDDDGILYTELKEGEENA